MNPYIMSKAELSQLIDFMEKDDSDSVTKMLKERYEGPIGAMLKISDDAEAIAYAALALGIGIGILVMGGKGEKQ